MMSAKCNYFPETPPQNTITQGVRTLLSDFGEGTIHSLAVPLLCHCGR